MIGVRNDGITLHHYTILYSFENAHSQLSVRASINTRSDHTPAQMGTDQHSWAQPRADTHKPHTGAGSRGGKPRGTAAGKLN